MSNLGLSIIQASDAETGPAGTGFTFRIVWPWVAEALWWVPNEKVPLRGMSP